MYFFTGSMKKELIRVHSWKPALEKPSLSYYAGVKENPDPPSPPRDKVGIRGE